jgi:hypothetical protein
MSTPKQGGSMEHGENHAHQKTDLELWLCKQIGSAGTVEPVYDGFEIRIINESLFPWALVFHRLLQSDHSVWLDKKREGLVIVTKASIP